MKPLTRWSLPNGLTLLYREDARFPLSSATLILRAGSTLERKSEAGLSSMTIDLLMQGTRHRSARQLARAMENVGAALGTQAHEDYAEIGFVVPASQIRLALGVASEILCEPAFPSDEIGKEKSHVLASLESRHDAIFSLAYDHMTRSLFGDHSYGRPLEGRKETVQKFRRGDFQRWHGAELRPENAILSLIGPMPAASAVRTVEKEFARWKTSNGHRGTPPTIVKDGGSMMNRSKSKATTVPAKFQQAYLMVGFPAPSATDPDHIALKVLNTLMGGGMSSRLFVTLRENLGLAYEVSSLYPTRLERSEWVVYLGLPAEKVKIASQKLNELLEKLAERGPGPAELRQAKAMIRGAFLMDRQSRRRQAWYNAWWEFLGRGEHYGDEFLAIVDEVSAKTIQTVMQRLLDQPRVTVTVLPK